MSSLSNIYDEKGYIDIKTIRKIPHTFLFIFSARGTGKTYPVSLELIENNVNFMYMRRTESELFECANEALNPFNKINIDKNYNISLKKIKGSKHVCNINNDDKIIGVGVALSTIHSIRGFDASCYTTLFYDEAVPQPNVRTMRGEEEAILHAYETCNRNRELEGISPMEFIATGNSDNLDAAIFSAFGLHSIIEQLMCSGEEIYINEDKGLIVLYPQHSPISDQKMDTALYKVANSETFIDVAIKNKFAQEGFFSLIKNVPLSEYILLVSTNQFRIFRHKAFNRYYVDEAKGVPDIILNMYNIPKFYQKYVYLADAFERGKIQFKNYSLLHNFKKIFIDT